MMLPELKTFQFLVVFTLHLIEQILAQTYLHDCNDPFIQGHRTGFVQHSYCDHACRPNPPGGTNVCNFDGNCLCKQPCYNGAPPPLPKKLGNDYCPLLEGSSQDPNFDEARCEALCIMSCPGGFGGTLCKESEPANTNGRRIRICTCLCPAQDCNPVTTTTPLISTIQITTTTDTIPTDDTFIAAEDIDIEVTALPLATTVFPPVTVIAAESQSTQVNLTIISVSVMKMKNFFKKVKKGFSIVKKIVNLSLVIFKIFVYYTATMLATSLASFGILGLFALINFGFGPGLINSNPLLSIW